MATWQVALISNLLHNHLKNNLRGIVNKLLVQLTQLEPVDLYFFILSRYDAIQYYYYSSEGTLADGCFTANLCSLEYQV